MRGRHLRALARRARRGERRRRTCTRSSTTPSGRSSSSRTPAAAARSVPASRSASARTRPGTSPSRRSASSSGPAARSSASRSATTSRPGRSKARTRSTCRRRRSTPAPARSGRPFSLPSPPGRSRSGCGSSPRQEHEVFAGETSTARMKRTFADLVDVPAAREPRPARQRPAHRDRARPSRRLHARARAARRDRGARDRHPREPCRLRRQHRRKEPRSCLTRSPERTAKNYVGGEWRESASGESYEKRNPWRPSQVTGVYPASDAADGRAAVEAAGRGVPGVGGAPARAAGRLLRQGRHRDRGPRRADRAGHDGRDGQAAARGAPRGDARRDHPPLRRRRGLAADRRALRALGAEPAALHAPAAPRRRRADHALELPDRDSRSGSSPRRSSTATRSC